MDGVLAGVSSITLVLVFAGAIYLFILGVLLPFFVFRIYQESVLANKLNREIILSVIDPESAANSVVSDERIRELQASYKKRRR